MKEELNKEQLQKLKDEIRKFADSIESQDLEFVIGVQTKSDPHRVVFTTNMEEMILMSFLQTVIKNVLPVGSSKYPEHVLDKQSPIKPQGEC